MIIIVVGLLGTGKTLLLVHFADIEKQKKVYANFNIKIKNFQRVSPSDLENLDSGLLEIDEAYSWLESRTSGSVENRYLTNRVGFNSRKRGFSVILSAQVLSSIDVRFRKLAEFIIFCLGFSEKENGYVYYLSDRVSLRKFVLPLERAKKLYKMYDTLEVETDSTPTQFEPNRLNEYINNFINIVDSEYGEKMYKFSKSMINDILIDKGQTVPSARLVNQIYSRIKRRKIENDS